MAYLKYIFLSLAFAVCIGLSSCSDNEITPIPEISADDETENNGDIINITITLDNMGGSRATDNAELAALENYVNPEKIRVLFFTCEEAAGAGDYDHDYFLFESKSRWIKQLDPASDHSVWSVSVPLYTYGNDADPNYDWDWDKIREKLTTNKFKIAILANRPEYQYYPDLNNAAFGDYWYDNSGPHWTKENSVVSATDRNMIKDVFDLHHCQFDPIYYNKSYDKDNNGNDRGGKAYDFIMGNWTPGTETQEGIPTMGATSSWLDYSNGDKVRDPRGWDYRKSRLPSKEEPIPMYGIQEYEPLTSWKKGTTVDLSRANDNSISLLRSVVKLELLITSGFGLNGERDVVIFYGNWFTRCEPMDVWTPTNKIWRDNHGSVNNWTDSDCEWKLIWDQGTIANINQTNGVTSYKQKLSWQYGLWKKKKNWSFGSTIDTYFNNQYGSITGDNIDKRFPHIFNPCIQRIQRVYVDKTYTDGVYDHYVVYCGERNVNDPSSLVDPSSSGSGNSPVLYWCIITGEKDNEGKYTGYVNSITDRGDNVYNVASCAKTYSLPIVDYEAGASVWNCTRNGILTTEKQTSPGPGGLWYPDNSPRDVRTINNLGANGTGMGEYCRRVAGHSEGSGDYRAGDNYNTYSGRDIPLPLIRNHIYKLTLGYSRNGEDIGFNIRSEVLATEDISFK